ncbi:Alkanesulfonate monooxygenase [Naviculisporaceae sp. PSN 640]
MPVEFISLTHHNPSTELHPLPPSSPENGIHLPYLTTYARTLDQYAFNYTLVPYSSLSFDPFTLGTFIASQTTSLKIIIALRPNTVYPTVAAKSLLTLDQLSQGRAVVHFIAGGSDADQAREGDLLPKEKRYARLEDYIKILKRAWSSPEPFSWNSEFYTFTDFSTGPSVRPYDRSAKGIPISVGGSSDEAYRIGGSLADIFGLWGEPLKETKEQIDRIYAEAAKAGRPEGDRPRIWVTFRPIIAETDDLAWKKAHKILDQLKANAAENNKRFIPFDSTKKTEGNPDNSKPAETPQPQNVGSQRLLKIASRGDVHDKCLWYPTVTATNARGASTALVGSWDTVADSLLDYVDLGCELISIRGYDTYNDVVDYGRYILPRVREGIRQREEKAKGVTNGTLSERPRENGTEDGAVGVENGQA